MEKHYRDLGVDVRINQPFRRYDIAIYFRGMRKRDYWRVRMLRLISRRVYWDTVVDYYDRHEAAAPDQVEYARKISSFTDGVICVTETIAKSGRRFNPNVFVMPDPLDLEHFSFRKEAINWDRPIYIWSGVSKKAHFLEDYRERINGRTRLITETEVPLSFRYEFVRWRYETFPQEAARGDIALLPRKLDSSYNLGHAAFKALPFVAAGVPVLANKIPSYVELAKYYDAIVFLEDHPDFDSAFRELRMRNRDPARAREFYSCETWANRMVEYFESELKR
jgi:hypothetical protein